MERDFFVLAEYLNSDSTIYKGARSNITSHSLFSFARQRVLRFELVE